MTLSNKKVTKCIKIVLYTAVTKNIHYLNDHYLGFIKYFLPTIIIL